MLIGNYFKKVKPEYKKHYFCRGNTERVRVKGLVDKICKTDNKEYGRVFYCSL